MDLSNCEAGGGAVASRIITAELPSAAMLTDGNAAGVFLISDAVTGKLNCFPNSSFFLFVVPAEKVR